MVNRPKTVSCWAFEFLEISTILLNISHCHCSAKVRLLLLPKVHILYYLTVCGRVVSQREKFVKCFQSAGDFGKWFNTNSGAYLYVASI